MSAPEQTGAPTYLDLESAIMDAEGAAAVLEVLESELMSSTTAGWKALRLEPREDLCVTTLSPAEDRALRHASQGLMRAIAEVSRVFYAMRREKAG